MNTVEKGHTTIINRYIHNSYKHELKVFQKNLNNIRSHLGEENIHRLRVDIKRIKAFYELIEAIYPGKFEAEKYSLVFKKIFKSAGVMREIQTNKIYIKLYSLPVSALSIYKRSLNIEEKKARHSFKRSIECFDFDTVQNQQNTLLRLLDELELQQFNEECKHFMINECKAVEHLNKTPFKNATLHEIRKHFKKLITATLFLHGYLPDNTLRTLIRELKNTEQVIGVWHDNSIFKKSLKSIIKSNHNITLQNKVALEKVLKAIGIKNEKLVKEIASKINSTMYLLKKLEEPSYVILA